MKFLTKYPIMPLSTANARPDAGMTYQDISGTFSIIVELMMILVNLIPLVVILKWKKFRERTRTDDLVVALNLTYIVSVVIPTPLGHISYFNDKWYGGKKTCYFYQITTTWFRLCCLFIVSILCVDKSIAVYLYMKRNYTERYDGKSKTLLSVITVVLLSLFISCLPVMGFGPTGDERTRCESWISFTPKNKNENIYIIVYLTCGFGNFLCAFTTNCYMGMNLRKMKKHLYGGNNSSISGNDVRWQIEGTVVLHGVRMIMAVTVLLYLTWFPALILITLQRTGYLISNISILYALLSTSLSGLLNPVLYGLFDHSYRRGYKKLFQSIKSKCCCCCTRNYNTVTVVSDETAVARSSSDVIGLSRERNRNNVPRTTSMASSTSGFHNIAFNENSINDEINETPSTSRYSTGIVRHINQDLQTSIANEDTSLLTKSPQFTPSSPFGDPQDDHDHHSSSSSLLSSEYETYDEDGDVRASDSDSYEDIDESAVVESAM